MLRIKYNELKRILDIKSQDLSCVEKTVSEIISDVKKNGDSALKFWTKKLDGVDIKDFCVSEKEIKNCLKQITENDKKIILNAAKRIERYHKKQKINPFTIKEKGIRIDFRIKPVEKVGIYIPAGTAPLVSTVLMTAIPAKIAGVDEIIACSPPVYNGSIHPYIIGTLSLLGVKKIFKAGGSQAIAAMAFGTQTIPKVNIIAGPGNIFVNAAKKILSGSVGIDLLAGPSELVVLVDETANPDYVIADLRSQEEHKDSLVFLVSTDEKLAKKISKNVKTGYWLLAENIEKGIETINLIAPEHLQIICKNARKLSEKVIAGAVFIGNYTPCAVGDYIAGPSHTLPTGQSAAFDSGLNVFNFLRTYAVIETDWNFFEKNGNIAERLAEIEKLYNHCFSLKIRRNISKKGEKDEHRTSC